MESHGPFVVVTLPTGETRWVFFLVQADLEKARACIPQEQSDHLQHSQMLPIYHPLCQQGLLRFICNEIVCGELPQEITTLRGRCLKPSIVSIFVEDDDHPLFVI